MTEEELLKNRLRDLADRAYEHNQYTFTNFLNMLEISLLAETAREFSYIPYTLSGGYAGSERQIARFGSKEVLGYEMPFPIQCILIQPLIPKFADKFSHRDFLGALMNLGIERNMLGDILLKEENAYVFCHEKMAEYLAENLDQVKHTHVKCEIVTEFPEASCHSFENIRIVAASERIDGLLAKTVKMSRSQVLQLFQEKKVFINSRLCENSNQLLKKDDVIAVRGYGKMIYKGVQYATRKDKLCVELQKYI